MILLLYLLVGHIAQVIYGEDNEPKYIMYICWPAVLILATVIHLEEVIRDINQKYRNKRYKNDPRPPTN